MDGAMMQLEDRRRTRDFEQTWFVGFAESDGDFRESLRLVQKRYEARGYLGSDQEQADLTLFHILPATRTILVKALGRVLATVTFVPDSPLGLPAEDIFSSELGALRMEGRHLAELSGLAVEDRIRIEDRPNLTRWLFHAIETLVRGQGRIDELVITVNPRHEGFYVRRLGFERLAGPRPHPKVSGADAVLMRLRADLDRSHLRWWEVAKEESRRLMDSLISGDPGWNWDDRRLRRWADALRFNADRVTETGCHYVRALFPTFDWPEECARASFV